VITSEYKAQESHDERLYEVEERADWIFNAQFRDEIVNAV